VIAGSAAASPLLCSWATVRSSGRTDRDAGRRYELSNVERTSVACLSHALIRFLARRTGRSWREKSTGIESRNDETVRQMYNGEVDNWQERNRVAAAVRPVAAHVTVDVVTERRRASASIRNAGTEFRSRGSPCLPCHGRVKIPACVSWWCAYDVLLGLFPCVYLAGHYEGEAARAHENSAGPVRKACMTHTHLAMLAETPARSPVELRQAASAGRVGQRRAAVRLRSHMLPFGWNADRRGFLSSITR